MAWVLYSIGLRVFLLGMHIASLMGHQKARKSLAGRRGWADRLSSSIKAIENTRQGRWIHIHCASLGEFEQGAPVMSALRKQAPDRPILLTFFSPSGMDSVAPDMADHVDYLPFDTARNMRLFHDVLPAADTVLVKYELWPRLLETRLAAGTHIHLIAARFDARQYPANFWGGWIRKKLAHFKTVLVQDAASARVISGFGIHAQTAGDPRMDRVCETFRTAPSKATQTKLNQISQWSGDRKILVAGSVWPGEWSAIRELIPRLSASGWCVLCAPHEVQNQAVVEWASESGFQRTSQHSDTPLSPSDGLILDEMGILKHAYSLGHAAIVGGGWGAGVHNTLEPAVFGLPIAVGPKVQGFREIQSLQSLGALTVCPSPKDMTQLVGSWMSNSEPETDGKAAAHWILDNSGAANTIASHILGT